MLINHISTEDKFEVVQKSFKELLATNAILVFRDTICVTQNRIRARDFRSNSLGT